MMGIDDKSSALAQIQKVKPFTIQGFMPGNDSAWFLILRQSYTLLCLAEIKSDWITSRINLVYYSHLLAIWQSFLSVF